MTANGKRMGDNAETKNRLWSDRSLNNTHCRRAMRERVHRSGIALYSEPELIYVCCYGPGYKAALKNYALHTCIILFN